jgi:hypothetical protein
LSIRVEGPRDTLAAGYTRLGGHSMTGRWRLSLTLWDENRSTSVGELHADRAGELAGTWLAALTACRRPRIGAIAATFISFSVTNRTAKGVRC